MTEEPQEPVKGNAKLPQNSEPRMSTQKPGIYRGAASGAFGLWRLTPSGKWLFSMPVDGFAWRPSNLAPEEFARFVPIALDDEDGSA